MYSQRFTCRELLGELYRHIIFLLKFIIFQEEGQLVNTNVGKAGEASFWLQKIQLINLNVNEKPRTLQTFAFSSSLV